jgi:endonuclease-3
MAKRSKALLAATETFARLSAFHADAHCELDHQNPFQLIVAVVLSAQATDVLVNRITPDLFRLYPTPDALASASQEDVQKTISRIGMFRQKAKNIIGLAQKLVSEHGGEVPRTLDELIKLPGVGRKTANVVLGVAFNTPEGVVVDTHVQRISQRLGWTKHTTPEKIEPDLMRLFPSEKWDLLSHVLIFHGRRVCFARKPACITCVVNDACPSAFKAENIGRKSPRVRAAPSAKKPAVAKKRNKTKRAVVKKKTTKRR